MALHAELRFGVRLFREPDAGNPPVRFDEREEETELRQTGLRRRGESPANRRREATVTAPLLDSTQNGWLGRFWEQSPSQQFWKNCPRKVKSNRATLGLRLLGSGKAGCAQFCAQWRF